MSDYCHRKVIRMKISEEEACKIFDAEDGWGIEECLSGTNFEIAPTSDFFLDYHQRLRDIVNGVTSRPRLLL